MGRDLTPEELEEFEERRIKNIEEIAAKFGKTPEEYIEEFKKYEAVAKAELKEERLSDNMTDEDFDFFVETKCKKFKNPTYAEEFKRVAYNKKKTYDDEFISLKITLERIAENMLKTE